MTEEVRGVCGATSKCCRPATSKLHGGAFRGRRPAIETLPIPVFGGQRTQGAQLRKPVPDGAHESDGRFRASRKGILGSFGQPGPNLPCHASERNSRS